MKKTDDSNFTTAQGRLPKSMTRKQRQALGAYCDLFSRAVRDCISQITRGETVSKSTFMAKYGLTGRQTNAVMRSAKGMIDSQLSNLDNYIHQLALKTNHLKKAQADVKKSLKTLKGKTVKTPEDQAKLDKVYLRLGGIHRGLQVRGNKLENFKAQRESGRVSICLGSRKLFKAQHQLEENGFESHKAWRGEWTSKRRSQCFVLGSKDETMGCQGCVITQQENGRFTLRIRMPSALEAEHGKYLVVEDVEIGYQSALVEEAIQINLMRQERTKEVQAVNRRAVKAHKAREKEGKPKQININSLLVKRGIAVNYRFVRDEKGYRVLISLDKPGAAKPITSDMSQGAVGIDFNADHIAVAEINAQGNLVRSWSIPLPVDVKATSRQNRTAIEMACLRVVRMAEQLGKPIIIESLNFTHKKTNLKKGSDARYNKMLSVLSYRLFDQTINRQAKRHGVLVKAVNPAYTSFIGKVKYLNQTRGNVHEAAAMVIARRGKGHRDRLPKESRQTFRSETRTFLFPVDNRKDLYAVYRTAKKGFDEWVSAQINELRQRHQEILKRRCQEKFDRQMGIDLDIAFASR